MKNTVMLLLLIFLFSCINESDNSINVTNKYGKVDSLYNVDIEKAERIAQESFSLSHKANNEEGIAKFSYLLGRINLTKAKYSASVDFFLIANTYLDRIGNKEFLAKSLHALGYVSVELKNYKIAKDYLKEGLILDFNDD